MLFKVAHAEAIAAGEVTCTIRKWKRAQAKAGGVYRTPRGHIRVTDVSVCRASEVSSSDLAAAGFATVDDLAEHSVSPGDEVHVVRFEVCDAPDVVDLGAVADLTVDDVAELDARLDRMDAGRPAPWTRAVLRLIAERPATRSADLCEVVGVEQQRFKADVRRLKNLGLTRSLDPGYELSPRGQAYLDHLH